ncbi:MAG: AbrB/MazE/SpoVT family DNA-binding domain-containing protein [Candidatus Omnitrophota bacterium]
MTEKMIRAVVSSKGQITIPLEIREKLHIASRGDMVGFVFVEKGVLMKHLEVREAGKEFSEGEWDKLEKLANRKGKTYKNAKNFLKDIEKL